MTTKSQEAVREALDLASRRGNPELHPEHLLAAILSQDGGAGGPVLQKAGADLSALKERLDARLDGFPRVSGGAEPGLSRRTLEVFRRADDRPSRSVTTSSPSSTSCWRWPGTTAKSRGSSRAPAA